MCFPALDGFYMQLKLQSRGRLTYKILIKVSSSVSEKKNVLF